MKKERLEKVVIFINSNFISGSISKQMINLKNLIAYIGDDLLSLEDGNYLLNKCPKLNTMIKMIKEDGTYTNFLDNSNFYTILASYCNMNDLEIELDDKLDNTFEEDFNENMSSLYYYSKDIDNTRLLTSDEERDLCKRAFYGDLEAKKKLIECNLRLVISVARSCSSNPNMMPLEDLIQEGNLGLIRAVEKFDYRKGFRFSTYARWWIWQSILRACDEKSKIIRIPYHMCEIYNRVVKFIKKYERDNGVVPSAELISDELEIPLNLVEISLTIKNPISLNTAVSFDDGDKPEDMLCNIVDPRNYIDERTTDIFYDEFKQAVYETDLKDRELEIIKYRYGLIDGRLWTQKELGKKMGITHERVRQIENTALRKLAKNSKVRNFYEGKKYDDIIFDNDKKNKSIRLRYKKNENN